MSISTYLDMETPDGASSPIAYIDERGHVRYEGVIVL